MKKNTRALLLLLCLSLVAFPSHAAPAFALESWSWAEVYESVLDWFGLADTTQKSAPAPTDPQGGGGTTTTTDGGSCTDPNGCPRPKP
jgi:hypothetical protein